MKWFHRLLTILAIITMTSCGIDKQSDLNEDEARIKTLYPNWIKRSMDTRNPDDYFDGVTDDFVLIGCGLTHLPQLKQ